VLKENTEAPLTEHLSCDF